MSLSTLLPRLDRVKETGHGKYVARFPGHNDGSLSHEIEDRADEPKEYSSGHDTPGNGRHEL